MARSIYDIGEGVQEKGLWYHVKTASKYLDNFSEPKGLVVYFSPGFWKVSFFWPVRFSSFLVKKDLSLSESHWTPLILLPFTALVSTNSLASIGFYRASETSTVRTKKWWAYLWDTLLHLFSSIKLITSDPGQDRFWRSNHVLPQREVAFLLEKTINASKVEVPDWRYTFILREKECT